MIGSRLGQARLAVLEAGWPGHSRVIGRAAGRAAAAPSFAASRAVASSHWAPELCRPRRDLSSCCGGHGRGAVRNLARLEDASS